MVRYLNDEGAGVMVEMWPSTDGRLGFVQLRQAGAPMPETPAMPVETAQAVVRVFGYHRDSSGDT